MTVDEGIIILQTWVVQIIQDMAKCRSDGMKQALRKVTHSL